MQELLLAAMTRAYERGGEALLAEHAALAATEAENARVLNSRRGLSCASLCTCQLGCTVPSCRRSRTCQHACSIAACRC